MADFEMHLNDVLAAGQAVWKRGSKPAAAELPGAPQFMIDEQAFHALYRRTASNLRTYAARVLGNATYADDIVQETYLRLVRSPPSTDDPQQLRAFLFRVASRLIIDHWRRGRNEIGGAAEPPETCGVPGPDIPLRLDMA